VTRDDVVRGYARALLSIAEAEGAVERVQDELYAFAKAAERHPELREALTDASLPAENRTAVVADLLGARAHEVTVKLATFLIDAGQARRLEAIAEELARIAAERSERTLAEARSAVPLTDQQRDRLQRALAEATGRQLELKVVVDPSVVGGLVARVGDEVFDGSVASRLSDARRHLTGSV
jgi:F-type H+-transporting ATPase subunit delta